VTAILEIRELSKSSGGLAACTAGTSPAVTVGSTDDRAAHPDPRPRRADRWLRAALLGVFMSLLDARFRLGPLSFALVTLAFAEIGELVVACPACISFSMACSSSSW
jgi:hypothetical protein